MKKITPQTQYSAVSPKKRMVAGVLFFNDEEKVLLVKPNYKEGWGIPGGIIEREESPRDAAIREVHEELGLTVENPELVSVGYAPTTEAKSEALLFTFHGGILRDEQIKEIVLQEEELDDFDFFTEDEAVDRLTGVLRERFRDYLYAVRSKEVLYLE
jgi:ADP-ribose pyrophosphatase YjhB (NUDIX family)